MSRLLEPARTGCQFSFFILPKIKQLMQQIAPSLMDASGSENPAKGRKIFKPVSSPILRQRISWSGCLTNTRQSPCRQLSRSRTGSRRSAEVVMTNSAALSHLKEILKGIADPNVLTAVRTRFWSTLRVGRWQPVHV